MASFRVVASAIEKPELDDREYRVIELGNKLEALLIHDPTTDKASAALDVNVGSFADPDELAGLAHFCEHLLFMGTRKYPRENEYSVYLAEHSGYSNAYTSGEHTNYYFEVGQEHLAGALDRFAQFFIAPLFLEECKDRELRAVDSENKKNLQSDVWRLYQLERSMANPAHPYAKFSTGNLETLRDGPEAKGIDVRAELLKFHAKYYSANVMKLVVLGRESLDELQAMAVEMFSAVANSDAPLPAYAAAPFTPAQLLQVVYAKPVMDSRTLQLSFPFPDTRAHYDTRPARYFSNLVGHEGPGSILSYLRARAWATGLSASESPIAVGASLFRVHISLTEDGLRHYRDVVVAVFQYLRMLRETPSQEWLFRELQDVAAMAFRFRQKDGASSTTSSLAASMRFGLPRDRVLSARELMPVYDAALIDACAQHLSDRAFNVDIVSQDFPGTWDQTERWYGTEYRVEPVDDALLAAIRAAPAVDALRLPDPNDFIATDFAVAKRPVDRPASAPALLRSDKAARLWYKKDDSFWVPEGFVRIYINNPLLTATPENAVKTELYRDLLVEYVSEVLYAAVIAELSYAINVTRDGLSIKVSGYVHKLGVLLEQLLIKIAGFRPTEAKFDVVKDALAKEYKNTGYNVVYQQITPLLRSLTNDRIVLWPERLAALDSIGYADLMAFVPDILRRFNSETLVVGNFSKQDALRMADLVNEHLKHQPLLASQDGVTKRSFVVPEGRAFVHKRPLADPKNLNSCIIYYCQVCDTTDVRTRAALAVLSQIAHEPAFNQLRTKEQLGYVVFAGTVTFSVKMGFRTIIQSEKTTEYLEKRIDAFYRKLDGMLVDMSDADFKAHVDAVIIDRTEKLKNLSEEFYRFDFHLSSGFYEFSRYEQDAQTLPSVTKQDVLDLFRTYVHPDSTKRAKLVAALQSQCAPKLPTLAEYLKQNLGEFWKQNKLPDAAEPSEADLADVAAAADPVGAFAALVAAHGADAAAAASTFAATMVEYATPPVEDESLVQIEDVGEFKASLELTRAPLPVCDLATFAESEPKL
ncbi:Metalloenzyme, LuxS/M16 peptidase-like protein [Dipodascopsis tothii]|uniref:Metalloenzyme, LuxS/M16 peptidase-like protein n=1 Tax=Dipodascopsis tothii TaxID=44089 RepID=UPI0034CDED75